MTGYIVAVFIGIAALWGLGEIVAECSRYERRRKGECIVRRVTGW